MNGLQFVEIVEATDIGNALFIAHNQHLRVPRDGLAVFASGRCAAAGSVEREENLSKAIWP